MEEFVAGRHRRARRDDGDRGRHRRPQRDRDADRGRRALRALPAAPAPRPGRARSAREPLHPLRRPRVRAREAADGGDRSAAATASSSPRSTWPCAARARSSAPASTACRATGSPSCPRTPSCSPTARAEVIALLERHGEPRRARSSARFSTPPASASATSGSRGSPHEGDGRTARRPQAALAAGALARRPPDLRPRPRDPVRDPRRRLGPQRPRPLLRHRGAGDRGDLARRRLGRARRPRAGAGAAQRRRRSGSPTAASWSAPTRSATSSAPRSASASSSATRRIDSPTALSQRSPNTCPRVSPGTRRLVVESSARRPLELDLPKLELVAERRIGEALIRIYERR